MKNIIYSFLLVFTLFLTGCADAGKDQTVNAGDIVTLDANASTASVGGEIKKYRWKQVRGKRVVLSDKRSPKVTFTAPTVKQKTTLVFRLKTIEYGGRPYRFRSRDYVRVVVMPSAGDPDTTAPVITLNGEETITLTQGDVYEELGATATDNKDGNLTGSIVIGGSVDTANEGNYTITYNVVDTSGNPADEITRTIIVKKPVDTIIIRHISRRTFAEDDRSFILKYDKNATVVSSCGKLMPSNIIANIETSFIFTDIEVGTFTDCNISLISAEGNISDSVVLDDFTFFKILNTNKLRGRSDGEGLDYVILADGFQEHEMALFRTKAQEYADYILDYDDNLSLQRNAWNIFTVETVSKESGADNVDGKDGTKVDTALDSYFWCRGISRFLCIDGSKASFVTAKYVPQFDKVLIITNSSKYGGGGGHYAAISLGGGANGVVHELGHSLAGLADEYTSGKTNPPSSEPKRPNVTINNDIATVKWRHWVGTEGGNGGSIGLYEGGNYVPEGVWRPTENSLMRSLGRPFYAVNAEAWALAVYEAAGVTYSHTPESSNVSQVKGVDSNFTIEPSMGANAQKVTWQVDDVNQTVVDNNFTFIFGANKMHNYKVKAIISDRTGVIRKDPNKHSMETIEWNVTVN